MRKEDLPPRIKFMIDDALELREHGWEQRALQKDNGPKTIQAIRLEAMEEQLQTARPVERQAGLEKIRQIRRAMQIQAGGEDAYMDQPVAPTFVRREMGVPSQPGMFSGMTVQDPFASLGFGAPPGE